MTKLLRHNHMPMPVSSTRWVITPYSNHPILFKRIKSGNGGCPFRPSNWHVNSLRAERDKQTDRILMKLHTASPVPSAAHVSALATAIPDARASRKKASKSIPRDNGPAAPGPNGGDDAVLDAEEILTALMAVKKGDFDVRLPVGWTGMAGKVADAFNEVLDMMSRST